MMIITKKFRWYWAWQFEKEARYIQRMAEQGQVLTEIDVWPRYVFKRELPLVGQVQLDYQTNRDEADYERLMKDAGWRMLAQRWQLFGTWTYWYHHDPRVKLYSDSISKCDLLKRIRLRWLLYGALNILLWGYLLIGSRYDMLSIVTWGAMILFIGMCGYNSWRLSQQIQRLQDPL